MGLSALCFMVMATLFVAAHGQVLKDEENPGLAMLDEIMKDIDLTKLKNMAPGPEKEVYLRDLKEKMVQLKEDLGKIKDSKIEDQANNDAKKEEQAPVENDAKKEEPAPVENEAKKEGPAKNDVQTKLPLERDAKKDLKERVAGLLHKVHDAYKKMDQSKKDIFKGKLVKLFSDVKTLVAQKKAAAVKDQKLSIVAGMIHKFKDAFDHLSDEKKHQVAYKVRKLYSDTKRLMKLKRDFHRQDTLTSMKAHLKDFIDEKIEETFSTAEEKDAKPAKITALMKRLKDNELPEDKEKCRAIKEICETGDFIYEEQRKEVCDWVEEECKEL